MKAAPVSISFARISRLYYHLQNLKCEVALGRSMGGEANSDESSELPEPWNCSCFLAQHSLQALGQHMGRESRLRGLVCLDAVSEGRNAELSEDFLPV